MKDVSHKLKKRPNNRFNLSQRFVTVHATRFARLRMNRANSASQVKHMLGLLILHEIIILNLG